MNPHAEPNQAFCLQNHPKHRIPSKRLVVPSYNFIRDKLQRLRTCIKASWIMLDWHPHDKRRMKIIAKFLRIHQWHKLEDLKLGGQKISDEGMKTTGLELSKHLCRQERFSMAMFMCHNEVTERGVEALTSKIARNLTQLLELHLQFYGCPKITDQALQIIGLQMNRHLPRLMKLELEFKRCGQITDDGVESLISNIAPYRTNLRQLILAFSNCLKITDRGLESLILCLAKHLKNLETLSLHFPGCTALTHKSLEILGSHLVHRFMKLKSLEWDSDDDVIKGGIQALASCVIDRYNQNRPLEIILPQRMDLLQKVKNLIQFIPSLMLNDSIL